MNKNVKVPLIMVALLAAAGLALILTGGDDPSSPPAGSNAERLVRPDSRKLDDPAGADAVFVEFLDFECEACRAAHPIIEDLRATYGDRVTFVVRNYPNHVNSEAAAQAAEAAAEQGKFEEMYDLLFETQPQWGEQQTSQEAVFFDLAEELGLDMDQFRQDYEDPSVLEKIRRDKADGLELGVEGTPTLFLNGEKLEPESTDDLVTAIEAALAR